MTDHNDTGATAMPWREALRREPERYAACSPEAISHGSQAQMKYFVADAQHDIAILATRLAEVERERDDAKKQFWRPIETAPKEDPEHPGRDFEIIVGGGEIKDESADLLPWRPFDSWSLACYDSMRGCWRGEQTEQYDCFYLHKPTHWMPKFAGPGQCGSTTPDAVSEPVEAEGVREPVAWIITWSDGETSFTRSAPSASSPKNCKYQPLYTHAPKSPDTSAAILAERERCAAIADEWANKMALNYGRETANTIAAAIRQLPTTERGE